MGKSLREYLGVRPEIPLTHREHKAWQAWLQEQWNIPARSDYYLMQIAYCVQTSNVFGSKKPPPFKGEMYKIPFGEPQPVKESLAEKEAMAKQNKAKWMNWLFKGKRKK